MSLRRQTEALRALTEAPKTRLTATKQVPYTVEKFETATIYRGNGKWAKLDKNAQSKWYVALGWQSSMKADKVQTVTSRAHAEIVAEGWIEDS